MKLSINGKYEDVDFWSFMKCNILTQLMFGLIFYGAIFILFFFLGILASI